MAGNYTHTSRADGLTLTATIYNNDHQNHINNMTPAGVDDYSTNTAEMQTQSDPGEVGSESAPTSLAGELARIRFAIAEIKGTTYWYTSASKNLSDTVEGQNILANQVFGQ